MLTWIIFIYALLVLAGCVFQRKLLYFPQQLNAESAVSFARQQGFEPWKDSQGRIIGWRMASLSPPKPSVLIIHGNAGWAAQRGYIARPIRQTGAFDVYVLEYPGYGCRGGRPSERTWLEAMEQAMTLLPSEQPIYVVSESIGAGVAAHAARTYPSRVAGLAMMAPFNSLAAVARAHMPLLLPGLILRDRYDPAAWLRDYQGPIQFIIAAQDEIIPAKFGRKLYEDYQGPKQLLEIPHARHNDIAEQSAEWWSKVHRFWIENASEQPSNDSTTR